MESGTTEKTAAPSSRGARRRRNRLASFKIHPVCRGRTERRLVIDVENSITLDLWPPVVHPGHTKVKVVTSCVAVDRIAVVYFVRIGTDWFYYCVRVDFDIGGNAMRSDLGCLWLLVTRSEELGMGTEGLKDFSSFVEGSEGGFPEKKNSPYILSSLVDESSSPLGYLREVEPYLQTRPDREAHQHGGLYLSQ
ncbi:hypothetical protein HZH66_009996 [Vespula vulgaris]|uniref:Uncharacterized protein n=1 Tax=Vespula vulgaris TaxID=7454 RepID=A0A834JKW8_VESVU|nr:hypothetical protein HZH66_009996 [Vespula vulgaris]